MLGMEPDKEMETISWERAPEVLEALDNDVNINKIRMKQVGKKSERRKYVGVRKWLITLFIGLLVGAVAFIIEFSSRSIFSLRIMMIQFLFRYHYLWSLLAFTVFNLTLALAAGVLCVFVPQAKGAGVSLIMGYLNGIHIPKLLGFSTLIVKIIGTILSVGAALPFGPEGPLVHIGAGIASMFTRQVSSKVPLLSFIADKVLFLFQNDHDRREFISAGTAAGLAAAFGAPVGGILFSLEEASTYWSQRVTWRCLLCTTLATFVLALLHGISEGSYDRLSTAGLLSLRGLNQSWMLWELVPFTFVSIAGGILGAAFSEIYRVTSRLRRHLGRFELVDVAAMTVLSSLVAFIAPVLWGVCIPLPPSWEGNSEVAVQFQCPTSQYNDMATAFLSYREGVISAFLEIRSDSFADRFSHQTLLFFTILFMVLMVLSYGTAVPSGLFMPLILVGASGGLLCGLSLMTLLEHFNIDTSSMSPGLYGLVGAASMLGGTFRSSISLVVILLEGTGAVQFLLPILLTVTIAKWVGDCFNHSLYDVDLDLRHVPFLHHEPSHAMSSMRARDLCPQMKRRGEFEKDASPVTMEGTPDSVESPPVSLGEEGFQVDWMPEAAEGSVDRTVHCVLSVSGVERLTSVLLKTRHNGFPVVEERIRDGRRRRVLVGLMLRSQLAVLLVNHFWVPVGDEARPTSADYNSIDDQMRTYHHVYFFGRRDLASSMTSLESLNITRSDFDRQVDLRPFMNLPIAVNYDMPAVKVFRLFRTLGLRHVPLVNQYNEVMGMVTRKDIVAEQPSSVREELARIADSVINRLGQEEDDQGGMNDHVELEIDVPLAES